MLQRESKFFLFRVDLFSEGSKCNFDGIVSLESVSVTINPCHAE